MYGGCVHLVRATSPSRWRRYVLMSYVPCLLYFMCMNLLSSKLSCRALMSRHGSVGRLTVTVYKSSLSLRFASRQTSRRLANFNLHFRSPRAQPTRDGEPQAQPRDTRERRWASVAQPGPGRKKRTRARARTGESRDESEWVLLLERECAPGLPGERPDSSFTRDLARSARAAGTDRERRGGCARRESAHNRAGVA